MTDNSIAISDIPKNMYNSAAIHAPSLTGTISRYNIVVTAETHHQSASRRVFNFEVGTCDSISYITIVPTNITKPEAMNKVMVLFLSGYAYSYTYA